jgi:hypothetical protein
MHQVAFGCALAALSHESGNAEILLLSYDLRRGRCVPLHSIRECTRGQALAECTDVNNRVHLVVTRDAQLVSDR